MFVQFVFRSSVFLLAGWALGSPRPPATGLGRRAFRFVRRLVLTFSFVPFFVLAQLVHWLGFLLDDVFFRDWRRVRVRRPLFIVGVPRSGTTFLHRVLARDEGFTTLSTWECVLAPSVTERAVVFAFAALDRRIGRPLERGLRFVERRLFGSLAGIHEISLAAPEEDFLALNPIWRCFLLALIFPRAAGLVRMATFDRDAGPDERRQVLDLYEASLKKHLYAQRFRGGLRSGGGRDAEPAELRMLSKNASFAGMVGGIAERFEDARFLVCLRDPLEALPSQLSSIAPGMRVFGEDPTEPAVRDAFEARYRFWYANLDRTLGALEPSRRVFVNMKQLRQDLAGTIGRASVELGLDRSEAFGEFLEQSFAGGSLWRMLWNRETPRGTSTRAMGR